MKTTKEMRKQLIDAIDDGADDEMGYVPIANDFVRDLVTDLDQLEEENNRLKRDKEIADSVLSRFRLGRKQDEEQALHQSIIEAGGGGWRVQQARGH